MRKRHGKLWRGLLLATCCEAMLNISPGVSSMTKQEKNFHHRRREIVANPHFQQMMNPIDENRQNAPVGDTSPAPSPVVNLHVDLPNTDRFNSKFEQERRKQLQQTINTKRREFEEDIADFQQIIKQQAEEMKDLLALAEMLTSVSKGEQKA